MAGRRRRWSRTAIAAALVLSAGGSCGRERPRPILIQQGDGSGVTRSFEPPTGAALDIVAYLSGGHSFDAIVVNRRGGQVRTVPRRLQASVASTHRLAGVRVMEAPALGREEYHLEVSGDATWRIEVRRSVDD